MAAEQIDFIISHRHYATHALPIWKALPEKYRGAFYVANTMVEEMEAEGVRAKSFWQMSKTEPRISLVNSYGNLLRARQEGRFRNIYMEHGAGQPYKGTEHKGSYIGSYDRGGVIAILTPGEKQAEIQRKATPTIPIYAVGCPKLDEYHKDPPKGEEGVIACSFHWDCRQLPETRSAFKYYYRALPEIAQKYKLLGHAHPNAFTKYSQIYKQFGIEPVKDFSEVIERASLYIADNTSTLYEWVSLDRKDSPRPVVVLDCPHYRPEVLHGMRFYEYADMGIRVNNPKDLLPAIDKALDNPPKIQARRQKIAKEVYKTIEGNATQLAANAIIDTLERWSH